MDKPDWLEYMEHTADEGIIVCAADLPTLFARAAWAMFTIIAELDAVVPAESLHVRVTAGDREALLVRWLSELNFRHATEHMIYSEFEVLQVSHDVLIATVRGEKIDPQRHRIHTEIKAVTFHGLEIAGEADELRARVLFDV